MRKTAFLFVLVSTIAWAPVQAESEADDSGGQGHLYLGAGVTSLALDNDRVPGVPTSSPSHTSKLGGLVLGYQLDDLWAAEVSFGTDLSDNVDVDALSIDGYRFFGSSAWRPYVTAGLSSFSIDEAPDDNSQQIQAGFGLSGNLNRNLELRVGYRHHFTVNDESYQDKAIGAMLAWHFRPEPQPESVPAQKKVVQTYELQVQFDFDKSVIKSAYEPQFQEIAEVLKNNPDIDLAIEGHTCWIGTEKYNQGLSERRANAVKEKFVQDHGISPARITTRGYGESRPVADNSTLAGRQKNRRAIAITLGPENVDQ